MARDLGTERIPVTGERAGSDATSDRVCLQLKLRKALPKWCWDWLEGIVGTATKVGKLGVLVVKVPRMKDDEALAIMRWADFVKLHGVPECCRPQDLRLAIKDGRPVPGDYVCRRCNKPWIEKRVVDAAGDSDTILQTPLN